MVPDGYYTYTNRQSKTSQNRNEASIITYGMGVHWATKLAEDKDWDLDIVDLRTLLPIDWDTVADSVHRTNRVLVLHEDTLTGGIGGDIAAYIAEHLFEYLDAPVMRVGSLDTPVPFAEVLEKQFLPVQRLYEQMLKLISY